jgi:type 1 glutamine amidotransferase
MSAAPASPKLRVDGRLIVGGMAHDFDYARLELLTALAAHEHVRVSVSDSFEDLDALSRGRFLITYTCNLQPSTSAERALADFVEGGGRWFALHATNSLLAWTEQGVAARAEAPLFMEVLGSQFAAHPPIGSFRVENVAPHHPLTAGVDAFDTVDELYLSRLSGDLELLLATRFSGEAPGFIDSDWTDDALRPVLYLRPRGAGTVLYCTLGHCRGHYDAPHRTPYFPHVERCSWETPAFREILRRGIAWAAEAPPLGATTAGLSLIAPKQKEDGHGR